MSLDSCNAARQIIREILGRNMELSSCSLKPECFRERIIEHGIISRIQLLITCLMYQRISSDIGTSQNLTAKVNNSKPDQEKIVKTAVNILQILIKLS